MTLPYCQPLQVRFASQVKYSQLEFDNEHDYDSFIQNQIIPAAQKIIDNYVRHNFHSNSGTLTLDGNGCDTLLIQPPYVPVLTVVSCTVDDVDVTSNVKTYDSFLRLTSGSFYKTAPQNVTLALTYGYSAIPEDIKSYVCPQICANMLADMIKRKLTPEWISMALSQEEGSGLLRIIGANTKTLTPEIKEILDKYRYSSIDIT